MSNSQIYTDPVTGDSQYVDFDEFSAEDEYIGSPEQYLDLCEQLGEEAVGELTWEQFLELARQIH